jgi:DNA adenine methylase
MHETRGRANLYLYELTDRQHLSLLALLRRLPCSVMLSGYWTRTYGDALKDWHSITFQAVNRAGQCTTEVLWSNFPEPVALHDYRYLGKNFRERERIKRKTNRWVTRLRSMPILERRALLHAITEAWGFPRAGIAGAGEGAPGDRVPPLVAIEASMCDNSKGAGVGGGV